MPAAVTYHAPARVTARRAWVRVHSRALAQAITLTRLAWHARAVADRFAEIDSVYQAIGAGLFDSDDLHQALSARDPDEAAFFSLVVVGSEIDNGGFAQLFTNSTGDLYADAIAGAGRFDLNEHARLLRDAGRDFFPGGVAADQWARLKRWEAVAERRSSPDGRWPVPDAAGEIPAS